MAVTDSQGNDGAINVTISTEGITIRGKGTQREVKIGYTDLVAASASPDNMPAKFESDKMSWLLNKAAAPKKDDTAVTSTQVSHDSEDLGMADV